MSVMRAEQGRLEELKAEIQDSGAAVRNAEMALSQYLSTHGNAHHVQAGPHGIIVRLRAMDADLQLTSSERKRGEAHDRFWRVQQGYGDLQENINYGGVYGGRRKRS